MVRLLITRGHVDTNLEKLNDKPLLHSLIVDEGGEDEETRREFARYGMFLTVAVYYCCC